MPYADREKQLTYWRQYNHTNKERRSQQGKAWREANHEILKSKKAEYERVNRERIRIHRRLYVAQNRDKFNAYYAAYYAAHRDSSIAAATRWQQEHRKHRREYLRAYKGASPETWQAYAARYYAKNRDAIKRHIAHWCAANPDKVRFTQAARRARVLGAECGDPKAVSAFYEHIRTARVIRCHYCKRKLKAGERTVDHATPLTRGGKHDPANLVPSCKSCNSRKNDKTPDEFQRYLAVFSVAQE